MISSVSQSLPIKQLTMNAIASPHSETAVIADSFVKIAPRPGFFARQLMNLILALVTTPNRLLSTFPHHISLRERIRLVPGLKTVQLKSIDNVSLKGYWLPVKPPSSSTVILLHGFSSNAGSMAPLAQKLYKGGHSVFMLDFRSHG